jgi:hypothetical protein
VESQIEFVFEVRICKAYVLQVRSFCGHGHFMCVVVTVREQVVEHRPNEVVSEDNHNATCRPFVIVPPCKGDTCKCS